MADSRTTKQNYQDIADAIRMVNGETDQYTTVEMAPKIQALQKKNADSVLDYYQLELLYSEDNPSMPTSIPGDNLMETESQTINISDKNIENKFNIFVSYWNLSDMGYYKPFTYDFAAIMVEKDNIASSKWVYNQYNFNSNYKDHSISFSISRTSGFDGDMYNNTIGGEFYYSVGIRINEVIFDDSDNYIKQIVIDKSTYRNYSDMGWEFVNPVTKLAIYGATPIYK